MIRYRPLTANDLVAYGDLCRYCFKMPEGRIPRYMAFVRRQIACTWGAFDGAALIAGMWYYPFEMRVGDRFIPMGGVAAVATAPEGRNGGLAKGMMQRAHRQMKDEGRPLAVLMPFKYDFYARMGYGDTFYFQDITFRPEQVAKRPTGRTRVVRIDGLKEWRVLERLRQQFAAPYFGTVLRDRAFWDFRILFSHEGILQTYALKRAGETVGYFITHYGPHSKTRELRLHVVDAVWPDQEGWDAIMQFLRSHRDQTQRITWFLPPDICLQDQMVDPEIETWLRAKMMLKLVDFPRAIEMRSYPENLSAEVVFDLQADDTSPWNTGLYRVAWEGGAARVAKIRGRGSAPRRGLVHLAADQAAIMYSGRRSASQLYTMKRLTADRGALATLDAAFPSGVPYMAEWF